MSPDRGSGIAGKDVAGETGVAGDAAPDTTSVADVPASHDGAGRLDLGSGDDGAEGADRHEPHDASGEVTDDANKDGLAEGPSIPDCSDNNPCTLDLFDGTTCTHAPVLNGRTCDDGDTCTLGDTFTPVPVLTGLPAAPAARDLIASAGVPHPLDARKPRPWPWAMAGWALLLGCGGRTPLAWVPEAGVDSVGRVPPADLADAPVAPARDAPADPARREAVLPRTTLDADFVPSDCDGGRFDPWTRLCWQHPRSTEGFDEDEWQRAVDYCDGLSRGGADDWVLPSHFDFLDILGNCTPDYECDPCARSARCTALFGSDGAWYWTSTTSSPQTGSAWTVSFWDGTSYYNYGRPEFHRARCVRKVD